jgi:hypothetical protein
VPKILKVLIGLGVAAAVSLVVAWIYGAQAFGRWESQRAARENPVLRLTPAPLHDASVNTARGTTVSFHGYLIDFPYGHALPTYVDGAGQNVFAFDAQRVAVRAFPPDMIMKTLNRTPQIAENTNKLFEGKPPRSDYDYVLMMLQATPDAFRWNIGKVEVMRDGALLFDKSRDTPRQGASGIFYVANNEFRGFQFGLPEAKEAGVVVDLYGQAHMLRLFFHENGRAPAAIPQPDINRIIQSVRRDPGAGVTAPLVAPPDTPLAK